MIRKLAQTVLALSLVVGSAACSNTARGVVQDTKDNTTAVKGGLETIDVKTAIIADKTIDSGAIDVDTYPGQEAGRAARLGADAKRRRPRPSRSRGTTPRATRSTTGSPSSRE